MTLLNKIIKKRLIITLILFIHEKFEKQKISDINQSISDYSKDNDRAIILMPETRPLIERLRPYEKLIIRLEEIFLLKRPLVFGLILLIVLGTAISIKSYECGVFATLALILTVIYTIAIFWVYFGYKLEPKLFPELSQEKLQQGVKFYNLDQLVQLINAHCKSDDKSQARSTTKSAILAGVCFGLAFLFNFVSEFYFSLILAVLLLFAPFIVSQPVVMNLIHGKTPSMAEN